MWCTCTGRAATGRGFDRLDSSDLWVHTACNMPTRMVFDKLTNMKAPKNAKTILSSYGHLNGTSTVRFALTDGTKVAVMYYRPYPRKIDMEQPRDLLNKFWNKLDAEVELVVAHSASKNEVFYKASTRARAIAEIIAEIMTPFFESPDDVAREAMKRNKAKASGVDHETPGLAESIWDPNTRFDGTPYDTRKGTRAPARAAASAAPKRTGNTIPHGALETAKQGILMGMFTPAQMAATYNMTVPELKEQLGLD